VETRIRVRGLNELVRDMRAVYPELPKIIRETNRAFANRIVPDVQRAYEARYPAVSGRGRASIRALAGASRATIAMGGARVPYIVGQEFGSDRYPQFSPWTGRAPGSPVGSRGRFLYPTIRALAPELADEYATEVDRALAQAFGTEAEAR
jgi:hypothetical protein